MTRSCRLAACFSGGTHKLGARIPLKQPRNDVVRSLTFSPQVPSCRLSLRHSSKHRHAARPHSHHQTFVELTLDDGDEAVAVAAESFLTEPEMATGAPRSPHHPPPTMLLPQHAATHGIMLQQPRASLGSHTRLSSFHSPLPLRLSPCPSDFCLGPDNSADGGPEAVQRRREVVNEAMRLFWSMHIHEGCAVAAYKWPAPPSAASRLSSRRRLFPRCR